MVERKAPYGTVFRGYLLDGCDATTDSSFPEMASTCRATISRDSAIFPERQTLTLYAI